MESTDNSVLVRRAGGGGGGVGWGVEVVEECGGNSHLALHLLSMYGESCMFDEPQISF